jgi:diguanylate cyclase (GGDEF)-like protein
MGLRGQLALLIPGVVALSLALSAVFEIRREQREALLEFRARNEKVLLAVGATVAVMVAQNDLAGLDTLMAQLTDALKDQDLEELLVVDDHARVLAHSEAERFNAQLDDAFTRDAIEAVGTSWQLEGGEYRISAPAVSGVRWATVEGRFSVARLESQFRYTRAFFGGGAVLVFLFLAGVLWVGLDRLVVRPLRLLRDTVRRMGEGVLSTRVPPLFGAELSELGEHFNRMASALQHEREDLEQVVAERTRALQELNGRLERLAVTDGLTGVYNHRRFQEALQTELLRSERHLRPMGVLMVDVDFFKRVNDAMGHPAGDELLRRVAGALSEDLRQTDLIARYGGEEFAVIVPETTKAEALQVAERMRASVETKVNAERVWPSKVTVSIGVASFPEDGKTAEQLLVAADQAMYAAKRQGRNRVVGWRMGALP